MYLSSSNDFQKCVVEITSDSEHKAGVINAVCCAFPGVRWAHGAPPAAVQACSSPGSRESQMAEGMGWAAHGLLLWVPCRQGLSPHPGGATAPGAIWGCSLGSLVRSAVPGAFLHWQSAILGETQPMSIGSPVHGTTRIELEATPKLSSTERESPVASEQDSGSALFPPWGRHSQCWAECCRLGSSVPFLLHVPSGQKGLQGGSGEGALPEPPAWEVPAKALCSCKADCNSLESFFYLS